MLTETIEIKSKGQVLGALEYECPDSFEEALEVDGEDKVFKLYMQQRKIRAADARRRELTPGGAAAKFKAAIKSANPEQLERLIEMARTELGIELE